MNKIITCNYSDNLIKKISGFVLDNYISKGVALERLCFVFGGRRPSLFLKRELSKTIGKSFLSPRFFTMEEFIKEVSSNIKPVSLIPEIEAAYIIYKLSKDNVPGMLGKRTSFAEFLPWAYEILSFILLRGKMEVEHNFSLLGVKR